MIVQVRKATADDAETIGSLNTDVQDLHAGAYPWLFKATSSPAFAKDLFTKPNTVVYLADLDGKPVGYVLAEVRKRPETEFTLAIEMMFVHQISVRPLSRRNGVGKALLDAVKAHGSALGISLLALDAWTFNEGALAFFKNYGLVPYNVKLWNQIDG